MLWSVVHLLVAALITGCFANTACSFAAHKFLPMMDGSLLTEDGQSGVRETLAADTPPNAS